MFAWNLPTSSSPLKIRIVGTTTILYFPDAAASVCISINLFSQSVNSPNHVTLLASLNPALNCTTHKPSSPQGDWPLAELARIRNSTISNLHI